MVLVVCHNLHPEPTFYQQGNKRKFWGNKNIGSLPRRCTFFVQTNSTWRGSCNHEAHSLAAMQNDFFLEPPFWEFSGLAACKQSYQHWKVISCFLNQISNLLLLLNKGVECVENGWYQDIVLQVPCCLKLWSKISESMLRLRLSAAKNSPSPTLFLTIKFLRFPVDKKRGRYQTHENMHMCSAAVTMKKTLPRLQTQMSTRAKSTLTMGSTISFSWRWIQQFGRQSGLARGILWLNERRNKQTYGAHVCQFSFRFPQLFLIFISSSFSFCVFNFPWGFPFVQTMYSSPPRTFRRYFRATNTRDEMPIRSRREQMWIRRGVT